MLRSSHAVKVGPVQIGGGAPVSVQSMARRPLEDVQGNLAEIARAAGAGCRIMRLAVPSERSAAHFGQIAARAELPLVADTHFDYRTTLAAIREGAAKVRINPGNMPLDGLKRVVEAAGAKGIPIRIGSNSGSALHLDGQAAANRGGGGGDPRAALDLAGRMAADVLYWAGRMGDLGFRDMVLSVKSADVGETIRANRMLAAESQHPIHLGVTAAGAGRPALLNRAAALGALVADGIGDTLRVSFTGDMDGEIRAGLDILDALGLGEAAEVMSCPGCGRCRVDLAALAERVRERARGLKGRFKLAVMSCEVNGPGEAAMADAGLASAGGVVHVFVKGRVVGRYPEDAAVERLFQELEGLEGLGQAGSAG